MGNTIEPVDVYELPAHWRSFIMDGDKSGMHDFEVEIATAELDNIYDAGHVLVDVIGEPFFMTQRRAWKRWGVRQGHRWHGLRVRSRPPR